MKDNDTAAQASACVNHERLQTRIAALAQFGAREDGGVARQTLTDADLAARRHLIQEAQALGCDVATDDCANLYFRRAGDEALPAILTGSHVDTQPAGGKLDGAYGVVAALEAVAALNDAGIRTRHPIEVVAWTNEEGCRFGPGAMGSSAFTDARRLAEFLPARDAQGTSFGEALARAHAMFSDIPRTPLERKLSAYVELHIEQGPVLEDKHVPLGVVTGIQGVRWYRITCRGKASHAGTTPMQQRADAMVAAIGIAQKLHEQALHSDRELRVTLGHWEVASNSINTIADQVVFTVDARCPDEAALDQFEARLDALVRDWPWPGSTHAECFFKKAPTRFPAAMLDIVGQACDQVSRQAHCAAPLRLSSGAFHDAMYLAQHCPSAMIFVPSIDGVSHHPAEATAPEDLTLGARALASTLVLLSRQLDARAAP